MKSWISSGTTFAAVTAVFGLFAATPGAAQEPQVPLVPPTLTLDWSLERAREANPALERVLASAAAVEHRIRQASAFEDPRFAYEASNIPTGDFDMGSTPLSGHQLGLR